MSRQVSLMLSPLFTFVFLLPILTFDIFIVAKDDEAKNQDVEETKSEEGEETQAQSSEDEQDNLPIAASIVRAPGVSKKRAPRKRKVKGPTWEYVPAVEATATYWAGGVEGKRTRTMCTASYRDDDARSDSEDDPEELFKPQKDDESSSDDSATEPLAKKKVTPNPPPHHHQRTSLNLLRSVLVVLTSIFPYRKEVLAFK